MVLEILLNKLDRSRHTGWLGSENHMLPARAAELVRKLLSDKEE